MIRCLLILPIFLFTACTSNFPQVDQNPPVGDILIQPRPTPLDLLTPEFYVVTEDNFIEVLEENDGVLVAMSVDDYEAQALNYAEVGRYIRQVLANLNYYESVILQ